MSTIFHRQTDCHAESVQQIIETFLPSIVHLQKTNWLELLPLAEFAYNNSTTIANRMIPFDANYSYHPSSGTRLTETHIVSTGSVAYAPWMKTIVENCKKELKKSSKQIKKYGDQSRIEPPTIEPGNQVMLNGKNIKTGRLA
jgi:hypothetical protein